MQHELIRKIEEHIPGIGGTDKAILSAVCIPLIKNESGEYEVLFEVRSASLIDQPKDICFPGGMSEKDEYPEDTALRELTEELLISPLQVRIIGEGDVRIFGNLVVYPYIVELKDYNFTFNEESDEVFSVPLKFITETEPEKYLVERKTVPAPDFPYERIQGGKDYKWRDQKSYTYFYQWKDKTIWGITAQLVKDLADIIR
ncbi:MAG: CoA pyrophosphatase [Parasporobacterium sp.]|nr:CoA pyrophosphatase [Parasporobacterium sp.]